ncbi:carbohydrate ABC transporter substrate-binding protein, CUT1 family [Pelagirhabdus alkalitolerans]|uniref:Carbohydrate ABC transporter substrate-binding protein, CUT1 family n=1 Tax=Pelagirhabdus alkalitolerans TaxID=1612202 RepID=A0A1G6L3U8_9BACI|nr:extracellular solute-binding protein [Pelagirhabdus alkalitolerans]SDC37788.1 carbohydrate ABC transporter substrate-binding protein, CUT1 family [Pelagirhabdus alkalitolerans]
MTKKHGFLLFVMAILMATLVACGGNGDEDANGDDTADTNGDDEEVEERVLELSHLWPEGSSPQHHEIVSGIIEEFEADNPGITIETDIYGNEQYRENLSVISAANELPDVGMTWGGGFIEPYAEGEMFTPLDDLVTDDFVPGTVDAFAVDGQTYALPLELNIAPVYYNTEMFEDHGLEAPETLDDLKHIVETLVDNDITPATLGNREPWTGSMWYMYLADRIGGPDVLTEAINREGSFEHDALIEAAAELQELTDMDAFINGFNGLGNDEAKGYFINEQAAMYMMGTWDLPEWTTSEDNPQEFKDKIDYFKFPTVDGGDGDIDSFVGGPGVGLYVSEDSDMQEEAKAFVSHFVQRWGELSVEEAGVIPATAVDTDGMDLPDMYIDVLNDLNEATNLTLYADVQMGQDTEDVHLDMIQALMAGEVTPEEFAENHEEALAQEED